MADGFVSHADVVKRLARLMVERGVPPMLIASNIKEPEYQSITLSKDDLGRVTAEAQVWDDIEDDTGRVTGRRLIPFRWHWDIRGVLQRIEMEIAGRVDVVYDRAAEMKALLEQLKSPTQ